MTTHRLDFQNLLPGNLIQAPYPYDGGGILLSPQGPAAPMPIVKMGGQTALQFRATGIDAQLPCASKRMIVVELFVTNEPVLISLWDDGGLSLMQWSTQPQQQQTSFVVPFSDRGVRKIRLTRGNSDAALFSISCEC